MLIVGLTGSIGMGKSTVAARFRHHGIAVFDADAEVHRLYDGAAAPAIEAAFPGSARAGKVDRQKLAQAVIAKPDGFACLEAIVHPLVFAAERAFLHAQVAKGAPVAVLEIPLLLETGGAARVDVVVVVSAPADKQRERVLRRPNMTPEKLEQVLKRQMPDAEKRSQADFIVDTGGSFAEADAQVDNIVESLEGRTGRAFTAAWV